MRFLLPILLLASFALGIYGCDSGVGNNKRDSRVWSLSVSRDGSHVVTIHADGRVVLWNLRTRTKRLISTNGNIYSAYFVKGRNLFLWQDLANIVHLTRLDGTDVDSWKHFPTYGHVISPSLKHYFSSDKTWNVYYGHGKWMRPVKKDGDSPSFLGSGKILNMEVSSNEGYLLTSGAEYDWDNRDSRPRYPSIVEKQRISNYSGTVIWDIESLKPIAVLYGLAVKSYATFSPDGRYVVSGDENGHYFVWDVELRRKIFSLADLKYGVVVDKSGDPGKWQWNDSGLIAKPKDFSGYAAMSIKFIDEENHYLRIVTDQHYAVLYSIDSPLPLKYLDLGRKPYPATRDYSRNTAIDSAPEAGILVTGQAYGPGINVYKYDKKTQTLRRIWVAK